MRSLMIIAAFTLFMAAMDLYAYRGLQQLFPAGSGGQRLWPYLFWGISLVVFAGLLWAGSRFRTMRDPAQFFPVSLVMGIFLL